MRKNKENLSYYVWFNDNNYGTHSHCDFYKNYCIAIHGYWEYYNKLEIIIYKYNEKNNNIIVVYHNNNEEKIKEILGKNFRKNTYETLHKKIVKFINSNIENK